MNSLHGRISAGPRSWRRFAAILSLAACPFLACPAAGAPARILLLGDSLTAQLEGRKPLYDRLAAGGYQFQFVGSQGDAPLRHEGHGGFTIGPDQSQPGNLSDNIELWIRAAKPDIIFLLVGNNDYNGKPGVDPTGAPARLEKLLEKITTLAPRAEVIVGSVLRIAWVDDYAGTLNRQIPGIVARLQARGSRVRFADLNNEIELVKGAPPYDRPGGDYVDGTHLNRSGGEKLAAAWFAHLAPLLKKSSP